jgi:hypothetical protein
MASEPRQEQQRTSEVHLLRGASFSRKSQEYMCGFGSVPADSNGWLAMRILLRPSVHTMSPVTYNVHFSRCSFLSNHAKFTILW